MLSLFSKGPAGIIGLDIGTHSIKAVSLKSTTLLKMGLVEISSEPLSGLAPEQRDELVLNALKKLLKENQIEAGNSVTSVSGDAVIVRYVTLPKMSAHELETTIRFEAEPHIPFPMDQVMFDYQLLGEVIEEETRKMEVILIAAKNEVISRQVEMLQGIGLRPVVIDVDAFALEGNFEINHSEEERMGSIALINIGATYTNINILENGISHFTRDVLIAGNNLNRVIQRDLKLNWKDTENLKKGKGTVLIEDMDISDPDVLRMGETIRPVLQELVSEIRRSLDYYQAQTREKVIDKIILSGGTAGLKNLDRLLMQELKTPVELDNPFRKIEVSPKRYAPEYVAGISSFFSVAVGLALRKPK